MKIVHQHPASLSADEQKQLLLGLHSKCVALLRTNGQSRYRFDDTQTDAALRGR